MDNVIFSKPNFFISGHRGFFGFVKVVSKRSIKLSFDHWFNKTNCESWVWQQRLDQHSLNKFFSHILIPGWWVIVIHTFHILSNNLWLMFCQVCIDQSKQDTRVKEQSIKNTVCNRSDLLRKSVFSNPCLQSNNNFLKDKIDSDNQERDGVTN